MKTRKLIIAIAVMLALLLSCASAEGEHFTARIVSETEIPVTVDGSAVVVDENYSAEEDVPFTIEWYLEDETETEKTAGTGDEKEPYAVLDLILMRDGTLSFAEGNRLTDKLFDMLSAMKLEADEADKAAQIGHQWDTLSACEVTDCQTKTVVMSLCRDCGAFELGVAYGPHLYGEWETAERATCTRTGLRTQTCTLCGSTASEEIPRIAHSEVIDEGKAATCTKPGLTDGKHCSVCGTVLAAQEEIAPLGHTEAVDAAVAPTCTETGLTEGKHCSACGIVLVKQEEIAALGHTEADDAAVAPTCTETGLTEGKHCSVCNAVLVKQEEVAALGHTEVTDISVLPTCTTDGLSEGKHCSVCKTVLVKQETIPATGHQYDSFGKCKVCQYQCPHPHKLTTGKYYSDAYHHGTCDVCGGSQIEEHTFDRCKCTVCGYEKHTEVTDAYVAPTCTEDGLTEGKHCSVCKTVLVKQETIPAAGHKFTSYGQCTVCGYWCPHPNGLMNAQPYHDGSAHCGSCDVCGGTSIIEEHEFDGCVCKVCGYEKHTPENVPVKEPTCTEDGFEAGTRCSVCQMILSGMRPIPALGHDEYLHSTDAQTHFYRCRRCDAAGINYGWRAHHTFDGCKCTVCGYEKHNEVTDPYVAPTCAFPGLTEGKHCSVCSKVLVEQQVIPALPHQLDGCKCTVCGAVQHTEVTDAGKDATCTEAGLSDGKHCSVCNTVLVKQEEIAPLGHDWQGNWTPGRLSNDHYKKCERCEMGYDPEPHVFVNGVCSVCQFACRHPLGSSATPVDDEKHTMVCSTCGETVITLHWLTPDGLVGWEPDCVRAGRTTGYKCSICGYRKPSRPIPALGHDLDSNCVCKRCSQTVHTEVTDEGKDATCTEAGLSDGKHCSVCNAVLVKQEVIPKLGHDLDSCCVCRRCSQTLHAIVYEYQDDRYHIERCIGCGAIINTKEHDKAYNPATDMYYCRLCGCVFGD